MFWVVVGTMVIFACMFMIIGYGQHPSRVDVVLRKVLREVLRT